MSSLPCPQAGKRQLARLVRFGPRKQAGLAAVAVALAIFGFVTRDGLTVVIAALGLLVILTLSTLALELMRRRFVWRRRFDKALLNLDAERSQHRATRVRADDARTWRDIRAAVSRASTRQRTRLFVYPKSPTASYLKLIYQEFPRWDFDVVHLAKWSDLDFLENGDILHYHWTKEVQFRCATAAEARASSDAVLDNFRTLQQRGVTIIWTVHETLPHECPYPDVELEFRQSLVNLVDVVSVLHPATNAALDGAFTIPAEKILVVPHPLYTGAQADHVTRDAARADLGYGTSDLVMLSIGLIRPYKSYERVVRLMPSLQEQFGDSRLTYVIAGKGGASNDLEVNTYVEALEAEIELLPDPTAVRLALGSVPENYLHVLLRSADVAVAPYRQGLNSGVLLMTMTHGVPTVISSTVATESIAKFGPVSTFPVDDDDALREALIGRLTATAAPTVDSQFIQENSPTAVSTAFAQALRNRLRGTETESVLSQVVAGDGEK